MALLSVRDLEIRAVSGESSRHGPIIVDRVSFELEPGRVLGLIGESGAGKSTIGLAAIGHQREGLKITGGSIAFRGAEIGAMSPAELRDFQGSSVAYVAQSAAAAFNPAQTLMSQIIEASLWHGKLGRREAIARATELFGLLALPDPASFGDRYPHQASGGQLQRAMTALALCRKPDLIVFDEPTTALDVTTQIEVLVAMKQAVKVTGTAALYISHDLAVVAQIADDILVLRQGKTVEIGSADQIVNRPVQPYTRELVAVRQAQRAGATETASDLLKIEHLDAAYGASKVLHDVSLVVGRGRTLAVVGESGSGKSTLARAIMGLLPPSRGSLAFDGRPLDPALGRRSKEALRKIQIVNQIPDTSLNPRHRIGEIVGRPLTLYFGFRGAARRTKVLSLLEEMELPASLVDRFPAELSGGQKQRVCIARALAAEPELIVCDEPTSALDPLVAAGVLALMARLQAERAVSYLFITHDIAIVEAIADTVAVMHQGRIVCSGPKETVLSPPFDDYTDRLLKAVPRLEIGWLEGYRLARSSLA
jgi:peptide/nickel transport system ATP-binding protein